jgi:hypothetical protein
MCAGVWWGNLTERDHWRDPEVDVTIILIWMVSRDCTGFWWGNLRQTNTGETQT